MTYLWSLDGKMALPKKKPLINIRKSVYRTTRFISMFRGPNGLRFLKKKLLARHFQKFGGINRSHAILDRGWYLLDVSALAGFGGPSRGIWWQIYTRKARGSL